MTSSCTNDALPEPTDETLVARWQAGDATALEALLRRYRRFARSKARTYFLVGADADDIEQEGLIGLYKAARDFQPERQPSFRAFAELCVTRQVISAVKSSTRRKHQPLNSYVSISASAESDTGCDVEHLLDDRRCADPADELVSQEDLRALRRLVAESLSDFEVDVLRLYLGGKSYHEIGGCLGRHAKSVDNALQRIKRKLEPCRTGSEEVPALVA
jgi:RNA polymerase sporulation-specific sigma factor